MEDSTVVVRYGLKQAGEELQPEEAGASVASPASGLRPGNGRLPAGALAGGQRADSRGSDVGARRSGPWADRLDRYSEPLKRDSRPTRPGPAVTRPVRTMGLLGVMVPLVMVPQALTSPASGIIIERRTVATHFTVGESK